MTPIKVMVMIWSVFKCWNCAVLLYVNPFQLFLSHALVKWNFLWNRKMPMWFWSAKKKKKDKQCIKNCRPVSLLLIFSKIFERLLFNKFFNENDVLSSNQSDLWPGDSCINQILSITHTIYQSFDNDLEVRGVFLDISKAFDKVWHEGLILELSHNWKPFVSFKRFF